MSARRTTTTTSREVICPYCGEAAVLADSAEVYGGRSYGNIYLCRPCNAYVGIHKDGPRKGYPLGRLADKELREWKRRAHSAFDPLWKGKMERDGCSKGKARKAGYTWLSEKLGIPFRDCHIGEFDVDMCKRVVEACRT